MPNSTRLLALTILLSLLTLLRAAPLTLQSPNTQITLTIDPATPSYQISYHNKPLLPSSPLGLTLLTTGPFQNLTLASSSTSSHDETYPTPFGKSSSARDHYNELIVNLHESTPPNRDLILTFRACDDGVAFRYTLPAQPNLKDVSLTSEETTFTLPADATAWVLPIPKHGGHYEYLYQPTSTSNLKLKQLIGLPLLVELPTAAFAITEANLTDYPGMALLPSSSSSLRASLTPLPNQTEIKARLTLPHSTPWRAILIGDSAGELIESNLISNLSDPCAIPDTSWIHPGKVAFLWWNGYLVGPNGRRGAVDTATFNHYVDAAAEFHLPYSSIDGLDIAWYGGKIPGYGEHDITVPVPQLDIQKVLSHAKEKGVKIRLWVASQGMRKYLDKALDTYEKWGVEGIMVDFIERDDQTDINWQRELVSKAAAHHLTVTMHNVPKPTGLSRTYPNLLTFEAVRNQEYDKWDPVGVPPSHNLTVPFTRMLAGPLDYHMGAFRSIPTSQFLPRDTAPDVMGTRAHQLAMYVVYDDPMPMAVDYPAAYRHRDGIDFLSSVPTTWDETHFLQGKVGEYITLARRKGNDWYIATMNNDTPRTIQIPLTFLPKGTYQAEIISDDPQSGPNSLTHTHSTLTNQSTLTTPLPPAGGQVLHLTLQPQP